MNMLILREAELRRCAPLDLEAVSVVEQAFSLLAQGEAFVPPIIGVEVPEKDGEVDIKTAYIRGLDSFAIKVASGFYANAARNLPTSSGMMLLVSAETGFPQAVLLDNGYLTQVRTGAAGALAARYLAPEKVVTAGVIGSGTQARYQILGLNLVRRFERLLVYGIVPPEVEGYIAEMSVRLGVPVEQAPDAETVVRESQVVVTTTPSREPYLKANWLHPCLHITAMGADGPDKTELFPEVPARVDRLVCDRKAQCFVRGETHHALSRGLLSEDSPIDELGELTSGSRPGRQNEAEVTLCDLTGVGVQDTAIARLAYRKALELGLGAPFDA